MKTIFRSLSAVILLVLLVVVSYTQEAKNTTKVESKLEIGQINGASFRIDLPENWNKGLVMYCHGYEVSGRPRRNLDSPQTKALVETFLSRGFAIAQSEYSTQGWAVKEAIEDTESLRRYFVSKYGQPKETYITGHSMGAMISISTIERYPDIYDGAMPMCGPLNPSIVGLKERVFDMLVMFDYFFPNTIASPANLMMDNKLNTDVIEKIRAALTANPEKAAMFAKHYQISTVIELAGVLTFFHEILRELQQRTGGNPFDNHNTIYSGFEDDVAVNRGVKRYTANAKAAEYMRQYYTPTGRISDPVLTIHTTYDPLVLGKDVTIYDSTSKISGSGDLFIAKFVVAKGHCNINPQQTGAAFDNLLMWVHEHKRPLAGELQ